MHCGNREDVVGNLVGDCIEDDVFNNITESRYVICIIKKESENQCQNHHRKNEDRC